MKTRSRRAISYSWQSALKQRQPVDNSVDEIIVDPIFTAVSEVKLKCSDFEQGNKEPEKQGFANR